MVPMNNDEFIAYARPFPVETYDPRLHGLTFEHTFVTGNPAYDWNCFGGGREQVSDPKTREICRVKGNAAWVEKVYGPTRPSHPMGLTERVDCVCHSVANRILAMANADQDVAAAKGDLVAVMMYGKYGFQLDSFISQCVTAAGALNQQQAGCVSQPDIDALAARIKNEEEDEAETLKRQFTETLTNRPSFTPDEAQKIMASYESFHDKRQEIFTKQFKQDAANDFQGQFASELKGALIECLASLSIALGADRFSAIFGASALQPASFLTL
jgi:hypothetical protein